MQNATLRWHLYFSNYAWEDCHFDRDARDPSGLIRIMDTLDSRKDHYSDRDPSPELSEPLTNERVAEQLQGRSLDMLRAAAADGTLLAATWPARLLFEWSRLQPDGSDEVITFTTQAMQDDTRLCQLASAFLDMSYSRGMGGFGGARGDSVHRENDRTQIDGIDRLLDVDVFRVRLREALQGKNLDDEQKSSVRRFLEAWERRDAGEN